MMNTFLWHDYETWGINPALDRPCQFAAVRTDENFNAIGEPIVLFSRPAPDLLPHPEAAIVTGLSPRQVRQEGLSEAEFARQIRDEMMRPKTCSLGYNTLRFDDEVTRYALYRNYYDPYEREYKNGNSRWDIIDMARLTYALRPQGIEWPLVDGRPSFRLENLSAANGLAHGAAHDALSDVQATIQLAALIRDRHPRLFAYVNEHRDKHSLASMIDIRNRRPLLHISSKFPAHKGHCGLVVPLAVHPKLRNAIIVFELSADPSPLDTLSAEEIHKRVFTAADDLPEGESRLPLKLVHLNKCPILANPKLLDDQNAKRLGIDKSLCEKHWQSILGMDLEYKLRSVFDMSDFAPRQDPEQKLYDGFISEADKRVADEMRHCTVDELGKRHFVFDDSRLNEMQLRYRARNFPSSLSGNEIQEWREFVEMRLQNGSDGALSLDEYRDRLRALRTQYSDDASKLHVLDELELYGDEIAAEYLKRQ